nr:unnamed protein product [Digitaria exilis]
MSGLNANVIIPKGFGGLTGLRVLLGFPVHMDNIMDGSWCSLEEIGPLSQLRDLSLYGLQNVTTGLFAEKARISSKGHLDYLELNWSSSGWTEPGDEIEEEKQQQQHIAEEVLEKLCPPPLIQHLIIQGYFGRILPNWLRVPAATGAFKSLMLLRLEDLLCCTKLPDGLCRLPSLKALEIKDAPAIKCVGSEFQQAASSRALKRISGLSGLHRIRIVSCPNVEVLEGVPSLNILVLEDVNMEALPGYLRDVTPRYLKLDCNKKLYESIYSQSSCERDKIRHIGKQEINCIEDSDAESDED